MKVSIVIPAFNERDTIEQIVRAVRGSAIATRRKIGARNGAKFLASHGVCNRWI